MRASNRVMLWLALVVGHSIFRSTPVAANLRSHGRKLIPAPSEDGKIDEQYVVIFKESVTDVDAKIEAMMAGLSGGSLLYRYDESFKGIAVGHVTEPLRNLILEDADVEFVEEVRAHELRIKKFCCGRGRMHNAHSSFPSYRIHRTTGSVILL